MQCIKTPCTAEEIIKKSRFIGILAPCITQAEVATCLKQLHSDYPDATHIAFAYRLKSANGITGRFHDAGEPGGTAGKPIYQHLEGKNLINIVLAVIRYYGGVKLGAGGLTRAYGNTAKKVLESAELQPYLELTCYEIELDYKQIQACEHLLKTLNGHILSQSFTEQVKLTIELPKANLDKLIESFNKYPHG
jgi:uncharacterized YigZ family protein